MSKLYIYGLIILFPLFLFAKDIQTPSDENNILGSYKINGKIITVKEYDVFGFPKIGKIKLKLSQEKREDYIDKYLLYRLLGYDNETRFLNYKNIIDKNNKLLGKYGSLALKDSIVSIYISPKMVKEYYEFNKKSFYKPYDEVKVYIKNELSKKNRKYSNHLKSILDALKKDNNIFYNDKIISKILNIKPFDRTKIIIELDKMIQLKNSKIIADEKTKNYIYLADVKKIFNSVPPYMVHNLTNKNILYSLLEGPIINPILADYAKKLGFFKKNSVTDKVRIDLLPYIGLRASEDKLLSKNFLPTQAEMVAFYKSHINDKELRAREKFLVQEIFLIYPKDGTEKERMKTVLKMENILKDIQKNKNFEKYAEKHFRGPNKKGFLGHIYKIEYGKIGEIASKMKEGTISDLIIQKNAVSIIKLVEHFKSKPYAFDSVVDNIKLKMINDRKIEFQVKLKKDLFKKFNVKLN